MSELNRIADLLRSQIEQRRTLAIGTAQSASIQGTRALYQTDSGIISAIATNFCYGDCLLAKVEGTWYAINPVDNREVARSSVDRLIQRKPRTNPRATLSIATKPSQPATIATPATPVAPVSVRRGSTGFIARISIDTQQQIATKFKLKINPETTAINSDYAIGANINNIEIPAQSLFIDINISTPFLISDGTNRRLILELIPDNAALVDYEISTNILELTIEPGHFGYRIHKALGRGAGILWSIDDFVPDQVYTPITLANYNSAWLSITTPLANQSLGYIYLLEYPPGGGYIGLVAFAASVGGVLDVNPLYMPRTVVNYQYNYFNTGQPNTTAYREDFIVLE